MTSITRLIFLWFYFIYFQKCIDTMRVSKMRDCFTQKKIYFTEWLIVWLADELRYWLTDWLTALLTDHWIKRQTNQWTNQTFERFKDQCDNQHTIWWINKLNWKLTIRPTVQLTNQLSNWPTIEQSTHN